MTVTKVVILQEYVPQYRVPFFDRLVELASEQDIEVIVAAGRPNIMQAARGDRAEASYIVPISQREFKIGSRRVVVRNTFATLGHADMVVLEQARRNIDAYFLFLPHILRKSQWALWGHGRDYVESKSRFSSWLQAALTLRSDWFFAYTPGGASHVASMGFPAERITTVMNAVDTAEIQLGMQNVSHDSLSEFRSKHRLRRRVVTFIGALDESKRVPFLLASIRKLEAKHPEVSFVIAGDGPMLAEVTAMARDLPSVRVIGRIADDAKHTLLSLTDIILVPGRVGLVAVDALAAGIPIVTTNWEYHAPEFEYLVNDVNCKISDNTLDDYAEAIHQLLSNNALREELATNSLNQGRDLGTEQMSRNFLAGILGALGRKAAQ